LHEAFPLLPSVVVAEAQGTVCPVVLVTVQFTAPAGLAPPAEVAATHAPSAVTTAGATLAWSFTPVDGETSLAEADRAIVVGPVPVCARDADPTEALNASSELANVALRPCAPVRWADGVDDASDNATTRATAKTARSTSELRRRVRKRLV
jgi:hypothetical protein